ncbi:hypothetical protein [Dactylosporangium sp. CA-139066]|uniref:hypothetical protein n=1 Tax=Dactylosporangium sp. CA-139066 TaxID=3239930 RepID=UPI003D8C36B4
MRKWIAAVATVAAIAGTAGCNGGGGAKEPKDEALACAKAVKDSSGLGGNLSTAITVARNNAGMQPLSLQHDQAMADAQQYAKDLLASLKELQSRDISPELRKTLAESQTTVEQIQTTLGDATAKPPDATGKLAVIDDEINRVCKGK